MTIKEHKRDLILNDLKVKKEKKKNSNLLKGNRTLILAGTLSSF